MSILVQLVIAGVLFLAGTATGIKWHAGQDAIAQQQAAKQRDEQAAQQREANDKAAFRHADRLATVNTQLGDAREKIAKLSDRRCLDAGAVRVLDAIGSVPNRADAGDPARPPATVAADTTERTGDSGTGLRVERFATERDVAGAIALCRSKYAEVSDQLTPYLDREDRLFPPK